MLTLDDLERSVAADDAPPPSLDPLLQALWWDRKGDWSRAHDTVSLDEGREAARIHAYLHRREGDLGNAGYWYRRAGQAIATDALADEWRRLAGELLAGDPA